MEMCIDGINWELLYILKDNKFRSVQELATHAYDMEITVKRHRKNRTASLKAFDEMEYENINKASKSHPEEAMEVTPNNSATISTKLKCDKNTALTQPSMVPQMMVSLTSLLQERLC